MGRTLTAVGWLFVFMALLRGGLWLISDQPTPPAPALASIVEADGPKRWTDDEKERLQARANAVSDRVRAPVPQFDLSAVPHVLSIYPENTHIKMAPLDSGNRLWAWGTFGATLDEPLDADALDRIAIEIRRQAGMYDAVAVRFLLRDSRQSERDPEAGEVWYAWRLYVPNEKPIRHFRGVSPAEAAAQAAALSSVDGETIVGVFVDFTNSVGVVALTQVDREVRFRMGIDPGAHWSMREITAKPGEKTRWAAASKVDQTRRHLADGVATDRLEVAHGTDGTLRVFGPSERAVASKPWIIAQPVRSD